MGSDYGVPRSGLTATNLEPSSPALCGAFLCVITLPMKADPETLAAVVTIIRGRMARLGHPGNRLDGLERLGARRVMKQLVADLEALIASTNGLDTPDE